MFTGITTEICQQAWEIITPSLAAASKDGVTNNHAGTVIVLDPQTEEVIFSAVIDSEHEKALMYSEIAKAKAEVSRRTGMPSSLVQTQDPDLYVEGDTNWGGSTVDEGGLVVAFSGVQAVFDEMIAEWMASAIRAICRDQMTEVMVADGSFLLNQS